MPFAPAANPDLAGQFMAAGIAQAGEAMGKAAGSLMEGWAKKAKIKDTYTVQGEQLGFDKNYLKTLSADEVMGLVEGKKLKMTIDHMQSQINSEQSATDYRKFETQQGQNSQKGFNEALNRFAFTNTDASNSVMPEGMGRPVTTQDRIQNAMTAPGLDPHGASALAQMVHYYNTAGTGANGVVPQTMQVNDQTVVYNPKGGNFQFAPRSPNAGMDASPLYNSLTNEQIPGWYNFNGKPIQTPQAKPVDPMRAIHTQMQTMLNAETAAGNIDRGIAEWNAQDAESKRNKKMTPPDPEALKNLKERRGSVMELMRALKNQGGSEGAPAAKQQDKGGSLPAGIYMQDGRRIRVNADGSEEDLGPVR